MAGYKKNMAQYENLEGWEKLSLGMQLDKWAIRYGNRIAVTDSEEEITYSELNQKAIGTGQYFMEKGIQKGDKVLVQLPNRISFVVVLFALAKIGAVPIMMLPAHRETELEGIIALAKPSAYIVAERYLGFYYVEMAMAMQKKFPCIQNVFVDGTQRGAWYEAETERQGVFPEVDSYSTAVLLLSGGTTGVPKLIPRTHTDYMYNTSLFTYILFLIAASRLYDPLSGAMANMAELFSVQLQVDRLKEIEEYPEETGEIEIHTNGYDITFDHVRFSYEKDKPVLRDVSFTAKQGQVTALVGPSGGGKSTVAKLAAKFYPLDGGRILLGGTDIAPLNSTMLMKNFSIVFQDVVLFNNTIMENIRVGKKDATDEEVIAAAKAAQCDEFISKLPDGYQTVIGENGSTLSGGECQRLSIARALLKDAPVILLDEATASLDVDNETEIQNAISKLVKGKTVLIIAHRMRTVEAADNIVVLSDGIVVENGTHLFVFLG